MIPTSLLVRLRGPTTLLGGFYFTNYGGLGALFPFLPLLLSGRGLSATQISWVMVITPLSNLLMPPLWGTVADALQARLALLRVAAFACGLSVLSLVPQWSFWGNVLAMVLISIFRAPIAALVDATTYATLAENARGTYGRIRVWGSVGFGAGALLVGNLGGTIHPQLLVAVAAAIYFSSGIFTLGMRASAIRRERGVLREALLLLRQPAMLLLLAGNIGYYFAHSILDAYLSLTLRSIGFGDGAISQAWAIGVATEVLVMVAAPTLVARRSSPLLAACALIAAARWYFLATLRKRAVIMALQTLHGLTFGLWYLSMVHDVQSRAPERLRTTLQASAHATVGLGAVAGYLSGGLLFQRGGGPAAFGLALRAALAALVCYALLPFAQHRKPTIKDSSGRSCSGARRGSR